MHNCRGLTNKAPATGCYSSATDAQRTRRQRFYLTMSHASSRSLTDGLGGVDGEAAANRAHYLLLGDAFALADDILSRVM